MNVFVRMVFIFLLCLTAAGFASAQTNIDADNANIQYIGRWWGLGTKTVSCDWEGCYLCATFQGTSLSLRLNGNTWVDVFIDNQPCNVVTVSGNNNYSVATGLTDTNHTVMMVNRQEYGNTLSFMGFVLASGKTLATPSARPSRKMEFFGDSLTAGYGNEGNANLDTMHEENNYLAYGPVTARYFSADYHLEAMSGIGLVHNNSDPQCPSAQPFPTYYDCTSKNNVNHDWTFSSWIPDVVTIWLGSNDFSHATYPTQVQYETGYKNFITSIRGHYPNAHIFLICNSSYPYWPPANTWAGFVNNVVTYFNGQGDTKVHKIDIQFYIQAIDGIGSGAEGHPNVSEHQQIANKVIPVIETAMGWGQGGGGTNYSLTASVNPAGSGTVALNPSGGSYAAGTTVTVTATAGSGYSFASWSGGASGSGAATQVVMNANKTVTANFSQGTGGGGGTDGGGDLVNGMYSYSDTVGDATDFMVKLNQDGAVDLKVYSAGGKLVTTMSQSAFSGDNLFTLSNNLASGRRLAKGLYVYSLVVTDNSGNKQEKTGKFVVQ